ncbi:MAG: ABC transporter ATP-binding protein [Sphingobacteriaceae bacterium]
MPNPLIQLNQVSKSYPNNPNGGVRYINLHIQQGEFVAILGESGSGKSTLLKLIYGLLSPTEGEVLFQGKRILGPEEKLIPGHECMKMIAQNFDLNTYAKVYDNIASMLSNTDLEGKKQHTLAMMKALRIDHLAERRAVELSGGEQQRVAIARALITKPQVLLLDEPFSQVDVLMRKQLRTDLKRLSKELGTTMILVSHDPLDGLSLADTLVIVQQGELLQHGAPAALIDKPSSGYVAKLLGSANILTAEVANTYFGFQLATNEQLIVYPYECKLVEKGIEASITQIHYQLAHNELELSVEGNLLHAQVPMGAYAVGDTVQLQFSNSRIVPR